MSEHVSEAFGMLLGLIEINGESLSDARDMVIEEGYPATEVDHLLEQHWDHEVHDD